MSSSSQPRRRRQSVGAGASPGTMKFLYGGYAVLAMAAVILSWIRTPSALLGVATIIIVLETIVSLLTYALSKSSALPSILCLCAVLSISIAVVLLFLSCIFFGVPERGAVSIARWLNAPPVAILSGDGKAIAIGPSQQSLPDLFRQEPTVVGDQYDEVAALSKLPYATIKGATIVVDSPALCYNVL